MIRILQFMLATMAGLYIYLGAVDIAEYYGYIKLDKYYTYFDIGMKNLFVSSLLLYLCANLKKLWPKD